MVEPATAVAGGSSALPTSSLPDLVRLFLSLSGPVNQRGAVLGSLLSAASVTCAVGLPDPAASVPSAAPVACSSAMPAPGASTPAGAASATASPGRCERAQEPSRPERRRRWSSGRERSCSGGKRGGGQSPSPARSARLASVSASSSSESSDSEVRVSAMPAPPSRRPGAGVGRSESARSASGHARSPSAWSLRVWARVSGLCRSLTGPARSFAVGLPLLLRVRRKTTGIVSSVHLTWTGMIHSGLFFASSGSSIAWRNRQV